MKTRLQNFLTAQAQRRPEATVIVFRGVAFTYGDLEAESNRMARALRMAGCSRGDRVGLLLTKSHRAIAAMFAALKADCIYVPLDPHGPHSRLERILRSCECRCVVAEEATHAIANQLWANGGKEHPIQLVWTDTRNRPGEGIGSDEIAALPAAPLDSRSEPSDAAHILFTSGSTGVPKGVVISHANVVQFVNWAIRYFGIAPGDRISGHPPLHFDLSTFDIYGTIAGGAQIHLVPPETNLLPHRLADFIRDSELTQWFSVPSALLPLAKLDVLQHNDFPALRRLLWCGEKFPVPALIYCMKHLPHAAFYNLYGPTETTIASSCYRVPRCPEDPAVEIPIGSPCGGERLLVLDDQLKPVAPGEIGNLYIGGSGLSPGYWKDPVRTAQAFLPDPSNPTERIYRTGDLARVGPGGLICLLGRSDSQVKVRGHRIELGEIETALHALPSIQEAVVVGVDSAEGTVICCACVPAPGHTFAQTFLKRQLESTLPRYMIPSVWMQIERMPQNANGKSDRAQIRQQLQQEVWQKEAEKGVGTRAFPISAAASPVREALRSAEPPQ